MVPRMSMLKQSRKPYVPRKRGLLDSAAGKPCPTCYAPMENLHRGWACATHGRPTKP